MDVSDSSLSSKPIGWCSNMLGSLFTKLIPGVQTKHYSPSPGKYTNQGVIAVVCVCRPNSVMQCYWDR